MSRSQRDKGKRVEREAADLLRPLYPSVRRSANQAGGALQPDLEDTPWWVEVSGGAHPSPHGKMVQALRDRGQAQDPRLPLVLTHRDRGDWLASLLLADWLRLMEELEGYRRHG